MARFRLDWWGMVWRGEVRPRNHRFAAGRGTERRGEVGLGQVGSGQARLGDVWHGMAGNGWAGQGKAQALIALWQGSAWSGAVWIGLARIGQARRGMVWRGEARFQQHKEADMQKIDVRIAGIAPLLQHRRPFPEEELENKPEPRSGIPDWSLEAETSLYKLDDGNIYQPADHIHASMVKGAVNFQIPGKGKKTFKDLTNAAVVVEPDCILHGLVFDGFEKPDSNGHCVVVDKRWVVVNRSRVLRYRPKFEEWALEFAISVLDEQYPAVVVRDVLDWAGKYVGIGDFRPRFGRFQVTHWDVSDDAEDGG